MLEIRVLGYPEIYLNGNLIEKFVSNKVVVLLTYIALNPNIHAREHLAGLLWGNMPDSNAKGNLRQALHDLNKHLGDYLDVTRQTVQFRENLPHLIDAKMVKEGHTPHDIGALETQLSLYRGLFLDGINIDFIGEMDDWIRASREKYRLMQIDLLSILGHIYMHKSQWQQAEKTWLSLIAIEPLQEKIHRQLMLAYARQGKYDFALTQYKRCEALLEEELAVKPMLETEKLRRRIANARQSKPHNLPTETRPFVGREGELNALSDAIKSDENRLITILGAGGIGKSRLAREFATRQIYSYLDGIFYVPLTGVEDHEGLEQALSRLLSTPPAKSESTQQRLIEYLRDREMLLLLDNFEHLVDHSDILTTILTECHDINIIVTSRFKLNLRHENVFVLHGLSTNATNGNEKPDAVNFLEQHLDSSISNFNASTEYDDLLRLCQLLDGSPLAIELASHHLVSIPTNRLITLIEDNIDTLKTSYRDMPVRHRSVRAVLTRSWQLLSSTHQQALLKLATCIGGFTLNAAEEIFGIKPSTLTELVNYSMLSRQDMIMPDGRNIRFDMHDLIRQYLLEKQDIHETNDFNERHATYYANFINQRIKAIDAGEDTEANLMHWYDDLHNWLKATFHVCEFAEAVLVENTIVAIHAVYRYKNLHQQGIWLFEDLMPLIENRELSEVLALLLCKLSDFVFKIGDYEQAKTKAVRSLELLDNSSRPELEAEALVTLGNVSIMEADYTEGIDTLIEAFKLYNEINDRRGTMRCLQSLAYAAQVQGHHDQAVDYRRDLVTIARDANLPKFQLAGYLSGYGYSLWAKAQFHKAEDVLVEALSIYREIDSESGIAQCLFSLGQIYVAQRQFDKALDYYQQSATLRREIMELHGLAYSLSGIADVYSQTQQYEQCLEYNMEALDIRQQIGDQFGEAYTLSTIGFVYSLQDQLEDAFQHAKRALSLACELENPMLTLFVLRNANLLLFKSDMTDVAIAITGLLLFHPAFPESEKEVIRSVDVPTLAEEETRRFATQTLAVQYFEQVKIHIINHFSLPADGLEQLTEMIVA